MRRKTAGGLWSCEGEAELSRLAARERWIQEEQRAFSAIWKSEQRGGHFEVASSSRGARVFLVLGREFFFSCGAGALGWSLEDIWGETFGGERAVRKPTHLEKEERPQVWILWIFPLRFNLSVFLLYLCWLLDAISWMGIEVQCHMCISAEL